MNDADRVERLDTLFSHVWMVRTFLKHCEEAEEDDELREVFRELYDVMHALGEPYSAGDHARYLKLVKKKLKKLKTATELFLEIQPEISEHTNFQMSAKSLRAAVSEIESIVSEPASS
jgi:cob(I)alamin adenosyltransferase